MSTVTTTKTWGRAWHLGDGLWWRNEDGVYAIVMTDEPEYGPRGGLRKQGETAFIHGDSLADVNRSLKTLGFRPTSVKLKDIKWNEARE